MNQIKLTPEELAALVSELPPGTITRIAKYLRRSRSTIYRNLQLKKRGWYDYKTIRALKTYKGLLANT